MWPSKFLGWVLCCASLALSAASLAAPPASSDQIARGKYLAAAGDCAACHTAKNGTPFAGGLMMNTPFGPISTPNITPDKETGIGSWSDEQFYRAMHDGRGKRNEYLYPVMPFPWYTKVTHEDVMAIKAYLFSLAPVHQPRPPSKLSFPFDIRESLAAWRALFFVPGEFVPDASQSEQINRGAYLVNGLAHCGECHDSRLLAGASRFQKPLQGGAIDGWYAPNITSDVRDGIGGWSDAQLVQFLRTGAAPGKSVAVGPMAETVHSLSQLSDSDIHAVAAYLKSTPPAASMGARPAGLVGRGGDAYLNYCASCHGVDGKGVGGIAPALAGNGAVLSKGPQNVIQVMLGGVESRHGYGPMPAIGAAIDDQDIAEIANFVRQSWGNNAPPTAESGMVHEARAKSDTLMNASPLGACPAIAQPMLAQAIADRRRGISTMLEATTEKNMPEQVARIVSQARAAAPGASRSDVVNSLTAAYCKVVRADSNLDWNWKALQLGHFSQLVYVQMASGGLSKMRQ